MTGSTGGLAVVPEPVARPRRCLLVEDSRVIRKVAHRIISGLGYQVIQVADPDEPEWISGLVWSQNPAPGTVVEPGTVITLRVAP